MKVRSITTSVTRTLLEAGAAVTPETVVVISAITVENPLAGKGHVTDLEVLEAIGAQAASLLVDEALRALSANGYSAVDVRSYGKGCIVGTDGDREHSAAVLHPRFGAPVRTAIGGGADIIPGTKKVAGAGASITMPLGNVDDRWSFDHMDSIDLVIPDAPRPSELLVALALGVGGRPNARVLKP
jgi:hypothetical protein